MSVQVEREPVTLNNGQVCLHHGDSRDVLRGFVDNSIDSIVTDPPYALVSIQKRFGKPNAAPAKHGTDGAFARAARGFMGKDWDVADTAFAETFWAECLRVLKPGGHVLAFGGTRTYHRLVCAIEDAGFEIRDRIRYDQSFDTKYGALIDGLNDAQREAMFEMMGEYCDGGPEMAWAYGSGFPKSHNQSGEWQGWGSALKPAWEPICLARKPLIGTVAANVLEHGTGALNIDGCRVGIGEGDDPRLGGNGSWTTTQEQSGNTVTLPRGEVKSSSLGRWPANLIHDGSDEVVAAFPVTGVAKSGVRDPNGTMGYHGGASGLPGVVSGHDDSGGSAARFFYCAKASRKDRDEGLEGFDVVENNSFSGAESRVGKVRSDGATQHASASNRANIHPTVKPTSLMQYLCRLITPPGGTILDPFMGSGSTGKGAVLEGFNFVGIEREAEYFPIAEARIQWALDNPAGEPTTTRPVVAKQQPAANDDHGPLFAAPAQAGAA